MPRTRRVFESVVDAADVRRFCNKVKDPNDTNAFLECLQFNRKRLSAACPRVGKPRRVSLQELPKRALTRAILGPLWTHWRESGSLLQGQSKGATTKAPLRATLPMLGRCLLSSRLQRVRRPTRARAARRAGRQRATRRQTRSSASVKKRGDLAQKNSHPFGAKRCKPAATSVSASRIHRNQRGPCGEKGRRR